MKHIQFEYDAEYNGGDYSKVGVFVYVPLKLCEELGEEAAFEKHTKMDRRHIVHYSPDELYDADGNLLEDE